MISVFRGPVALGVSVFPPDENVHRTASVGPHHHVLLEVTWPKETEERLHLDQCITDLSQVFSEDVEPTRPGGVRVSLSFTEAVREGYTPESMLRERVEGRGYYHIGVHNHFRNIVEV